MRPDLPHSGTRRRAAAGLFTALLLPAAAIATPAPSLNDGFPAVDSVMTQGVVDSVFPGAVLLFAKDGKILHHAAYGNFGYGDFASPVTPDAIYDLASVTKVVATTTAAMLLFDQGKLDLNAPVQKYLPGFAGEGKADVTVRNLLTHTSGLPPFKRYFLEELPPGAMIERMLEEPLIYAPGAETRYSDIGIILTGKIIEKLTGMPLDRFCRQAIFEPLGMQDTQFNPPTALHHRIPPTEADSWRGRLIHGAVHDENAFALGGVAGHAGLFSTAPDLARFAQFMLDGGTVGERRLLRSESIVLFTKRQNLVDESTRALGWDTRSAEKSSSGTLHSMRAFGHTGYTGTSIWLDPENRTYVILLTNRVHPTRRNTRIHRFRPLLHDTVMKILLTFGA